MKKVLLASLLALSLPQVCIAEDQAAIAFSAGAFGIFNSDSTAEVGVEYRFAPLASVFNLIPTLGAAMHADGGYWAYAGLRYDFNLNPKWIVTPNFAVAGYEDGAGRDLGHGLEFRTGLDLAYQLTDRSRLGLGIYHMSNAELGKENPGAESIILTYSYTPDF